MQESWASRGSDDDRHPAGKGCREPRPVMPGGHREGPLRRKRRSATEEVDRQRPFKPAKGPLDLSAEPVSRRHRLPGRLRPAWTRFGRDNSLIPVLPQGLWMERTRRPSWWEGTLITRASKAASGTANANPAVVAALPKPR